MLSRSAEPTTSFTRRDAWRLIAASVLTVAAMAVILGVDILPAQPQLELGKPAPADVVAPRAADYPSAILTKEARQAASDAVGPQYDYTPAQAEAIVGQQAQAFDLLVKPVDTAFGTDVKPADRAALLAQAIPALSAQDRATLVGLTSAQWTAVRAEAARVLADTERTELKDTQVAVVVAGLDGRISTDLNVDERHLVAALIGPLIVANSSYDPALTQTRKEQAAAGVPEQVMSWERNDIIVRANDRVTPEAFEAITYFKLNEGGLDVARLLAFVILSVLVVGLLLTWMWRFRRDFWHRNNVLVLLALLLVVAVLVLKLTAGRTWMPYALPLAAVGILVTVLLDGGVAIVMTALIAVAGRGRQRGRAGARGLRDAGRDGRDRRGAARRPARRVRPGGHRRAGRQRPGGGHLRAAG